MTAAPDPRTPDAARGEEQHHDHAEPIIGCRCAERYPTDAEQARRDAETAAMVAEILPAPEDVR